MTTVTFGTSDGRLTFEARDHAGDPRVCAAVSMMSGALAAWAVNYGSNPEHSESNGLVTVSVDAERDAFVVFDFVELGFLNLERNYGKHLKVISG